MKNFRLYAAALAVATMPVLLLSGVGTAQASPNLKCTTFVGQSAGWAGCTASYSDPYVAVTKCRLPGSSSTYERWGNVAKTDDPAGTFLRGSWAQCERGGTAISVRVQIFNW